MIMNGLIEAVYPSVTHRREQKLNKSSSEGPKSSITITL